MFHYNHKAITYKNIAKFSYEMYTNISINLLKYNNDSSTVLRILESLNSASREAIDDFPYSIAVGFKGISFKQIDRLNKFYLDNILNLNIEQSGDHVTCNDDLIGYSKYTDKEYVLEYVDNPKDFIRHSYPCDCFIAHKVENTTPKSVSLEPNVWSDMNVVVNSSAVTIKPVGAMDRTTKGVDPYVIVTIEGINIRNELVEEDIKIDHWSEFVSDQEYIFINKIKVKNSYIAYDIVFYPYINGREVLWDNVVTDREEFDRRNALVKFNQNTKQIEYSVLYNESITFPVPTDIVKKVGITGLDSDETVYNNYIDQQNGLFYVITSKSRLFCYPFIIPKAVRSDLDDIKTLNQSCRIDYFEDAMNEKYIFDIFPTSKANDIDTLDIYVNGSLYKDGMIIDLFRQKMIDNRIEIPFSDLFKYENEALIEFKTFGYEDSNFAVYLIKSQLDPLYVKDLKTITLYNKSFFDSSYIEAGDKSTEIDYPDSKITSGLTLTNTSNIYRLSQYGNLIIDGYLITDVFKTFYHSQEDNSIITSDTITHLTGGTNTVENYSGVTDTNNNVYDAYRYIR